jgi:replicative DNA helicase
MNRTNRDDRLTDEQQLAVIGWMMRNPVWFKKVNSDLVPEYFANLKYRNLYVYVCHLYKDSNKLITEDQLKAHVKQEQVDAQTIKVYHGHITDAWIATQSFDTDRLGQAIKNQRLHYEYLNKLNTIAKHAGTGDKGKVLDAVKDLASLTTAAEADAPTSDETVAVLDFEEKRWEESLLNRVPLVDIRLNHNFMLIPGITLLGGMTKSGKSTVLANIVPPILDHFRDKKVFVISNEDNIDLVSTRIACCSLGVPVRQFRFEQASLSKDTVASVKHMKRCVASRVVVASMPKYDTTNLEVVQELLENAKAQNYSAIMLDYYQIVANSKDPKLRNYIDVAKRFGLWLKGYAADLSVPMILFAQLKPTTEGADVQFSQRVQSDQTLANHVHVGLEIVRKNDDIGNLTEIHCHFSRHGDVLGRIATFRFNGGQLVFQPRK